MLSILVFEIKAGKNAQKNKIINNNVSFRKKGLFLGGGGAICRVRVLVVLTL
jgi:hypothetical protein